MDLITRGSEPNAAEEHARRLAAVAGLRKIYLELKATMDLTERYDYYVDLIFGSLLIIAGIAVSIASAWFISKQFTVSSTNLAVFVRYISLGLAAVSLGVAVASVGAWLTRVPWRTYPELIMIYALLCSGALVLFGIVGVIPIAILFP